MSANFFVHKNTATKLELAVLLPNWTIDKVIPQMNSIAVSANDISLDQRKAMLSAYAVLKKQSCEDFTEGPKCFVRYNNGYYLARTYKLVGKGFYKLEVTKFVNSQQTQLDLPKTALGAEKLLTRLIQGVKFETLQPYLHQGDFLPLEIFLRLQA